MTPATPNNLMRAAEALIPLLLALPENEKNSELRRLKTTNVALHSIVCQQLRALRDAN